MPWYVAHVLVYSQWREGEQEEYVVWENLHLIEAVNDDEANEKATAIGRETERYDDESLTVDDRPCRQVFGGVRKVMRTNDYPERPQDGSELTYNRYIVTGRPSLEDLINNENTVANYPGDHR